MIDQDVGFVFRDEYRQNFLTFEYLDSDAYGIQFSIAVKCDGFEGYNDRVFFLKDAVSEFAKHLKMLEVTRVGSVTLASIGPADEEELHLTLFNIDRVGHLAAKVKLRSSNYVGDIYTLREVSVTFEVETGILPKLVTRFDRLIHEN